MYRTQLKVTFYKAEEGRNYDLTMFLNDGGFTLQASKSVTIDRPGPSAFNADQFSRVVPIAEYDEWLEGKTYNHYGLEGMLDFAIGALDGPQWLNYFKEFI